MTLMFLRKVATRGTTMTTIARRVLFSSSSSSSSFSGSSVETDRDDERPSRFSHQRVWSAVESHDDGDEQPTTSASTTSKYWTEPLRGEQLRDALVSIGEQERRGGRRRSRRLGVLREDPAEDMRLLVQNYTVPSLASAVRDREEILQLCADLLRENRTEELRRTLRPFEREYVERRRTRRNHMDLRPFGFRTVALEMMRKALARMPRQVSAAHQRRAGVVLPLCNVRGVPSLLFEKRSARLRAHPDEVCLPGGMVSESEDPNIAATCLREMAEEIPGLDKRDVVVLGILRCNWGEISKLTGVAVTPLVCFLGEIGDVDLRPNPDEVSECFTVPISSFLKKEEWIYRDDSAPIFTGGPHIIWGLTGYIVDKLFSDVFIRYKLILPDEDDNDKL